MKTKTVISIIFILLLSFSTLSFSQTARIQIIHNSADVAADSVDIYLNGSLLLDNFKFRAATGFIDAPAGVLLNIGVAPANSTSANDTLKNFPVTLSAGGTYVAIADGVLNPADYAANPDGISTAFTLFVKDMARESALDTSKVDFFVLHGATDAPTVDILARSVGKLVDNAAYGDITPYLEVNPQSYSLDITPGDDNNTVVTSVLADLKGLNGGSAVVFASGFLNPAANQNGASFGIFAALANGTVVEFPSTARLQVIHNAADVAADSVDIYLNGSLLLDNFGFRKATPFINAPAGELLNIGVAPANSTSANDTLKNFPVTLSAGGTYVAIADGVLNPADYAANPDGISTAFTLFVKDMARESALDTNNVEFFVLHGSTDAPAVDILAQGVGILVQNVFYGDISDYISVPPASYSLDITPAGENNTIVTSLNADLSGLKGNVATVFASGFLNTTANKDGAAFGIFAALANGTVVQFGTLTGVENSSNSIPTSFNLKQNFPNPFNPTTKIVYSIPKSSDVSLKVFNVLGQEVATLVNQQQNAGFYSVNFDAGSLASGIYIYRIQAGSFVSTKKMTLLK